MSAEPHFNYAMGQAYLVGMRERLSLTQEAMAGRLGMSLRAYSDLETGKSKTRLVHIMAAERLSLKEARLHEKPELAAGPILDDAHVVVDLMKPK